MSWEAGQDGEHGVTQGKLAPGRSWFWWLLTPTQGGWQWPRGQTGLLREAVCWSQEPWEGKRGIREGEKHQRRQGQSRAQRDIGAWPGLALPRLVLFRVLGLLVLGARGQQWAQRWCH